MDCQLPEAPFLQEYSGAVLGRSELDIKQDKSDVLLILEVKDGADKGVNHLASH